MNERIDTLEKQTLLEFVFNTECAEGTNPNPLIPGKRWCVGDSYTKEEKDSFAKRWKDFADQHPNIMAQLPFRS